MIRVIWVWIRLKSGWFPTHLHGSFQTIRSVLLHIFCQSKGSWSDNGRWQFPRFRTHQGTKMLQRGILFFMMTNYPKQQAYYLEAGLYSSRTDIVEAMNTLKQERNNHRDIFFTIKISRLTQKIKVYLAMEASSLAIFSTDLGHMFWGEIRKGLGLLLFEKGPLEPTYAYDIVRIL